MFSGVKAVAVLETGQPAVEGSAVDEKGHGRNMTSEQKLGLRQAEDRLYRDYIHRLVKVRREHKLLQFISCPYLHCLQKVLTPLNLFHILLQIGIKMDLIVFFFCQ